MNKSELETQAEKICNYTDQIHRDCFVNGYVTGALKREQKIRDLKAEHETYYQSIYNAQKKLEQQLEHLREQIEKMKCCYNCSKWNDGECEESPKSKTFFCADFKCDKWECME